MRKLETLVGAAALCVAVVAFLACGGAQEPTVAPEPQAAVEVSPDTGETVVAPDEVSEACAPYDASIAAAYEPYLEAFSNGGIELSPDGESLLFMSNRGGGSAQLFLAPSKTPAAEPTPIAPAADRVGQALFTPDGKSVLFLRDRDNDENYQLYRAGADGSKVVALTEDPERFHIALQLSPDGETAYVFRGTHKSPTYELVALPASGGDVRSVASFEGFHYLSDVSPDGRKALAVNMLSLSESRLLEIDLDSGEHRVVAPTEGAKAHASDGTYSRDGKAIYVTTNEGRERSYLKRIATKGKAPEVTFEREGFEVRSSLAAPRGGLIAVTLDAGSHSAVEIVNGRTLKTKARVDLPLGVLSTGRRWDAKGKKLIVNASNPSLPGDIYEVDARGKAVPLRSDVRQGLDSLGKVASSIVRVPTFDELEVPVNVFLPEDRQEGVRLPVIVTVHGGPASSSRVGWSPMIAYLLSRGFAVVAPNVRGSTGFGKAYEQADNGRRRMDALRDLEAVNRWIREQPWAEPEALVVFGGSYGGYMTYMALGHQPDLWRAGIGLVGIVNLRTFLATTTGAIQLAFRDEFGTLEEDGEFLDSISPIHVIDSFRAPLFVYQGQNDPRVPRTEQDQLVAALRTREVPTEYMVAPDEGHSLSSRANKVEFMSRVTRFLDLVLEREGIPEGCSLPGAAE